MKQLYFLLVALTVISASQSFAQTASISPSSAQSITAGGTVNFTGSKGGSFNGSNNYTYTWASVASTGVSFSNNPKQTSSSSASTTATFSNAGTYQVSVTITRSTSTATSAATTVYVNPASTVSASATTSTLTLPTSYSTTLNSSFTANGNTCGGYTWTESSSDAVVANMATPNAASTNVSFTAAGTYHFTVAANFNYQYGSGSDQATDNVTVTVNPGSTSTYTNNLFALSSSGASFSGFAVGSDSVHSGMVINGMTSVSSISGSASAALGEDANGYFYYMPNVSNNGTVTLYAMMHDGTHQTSIATIDMNGSSDNTNLGFVRLGIDASGYGWILASNGSNALYLAKFQANGLAATTITIVNSSVSVSGGGSASTFGSGDLAFDKFGEMYALANDNNNNTYIYIMNTNVNTTSVSRKWTLVDPNGNNFTGSVNGCAFDSAGSMYISTSNGLYFVDATTINTAGAGTVTTRLAFNGSGFTDLATNIFPLKSTLPISLISFTATKQGSNALIQWSTETEINSNYVDVERSSNATDFDKVGTVAASGNTSTVQNYQLIDPISGLSGIVYYRLKEVDIDGEVNYSNIIALHLDGSSVSADFSVYPNPFVSSVKIVATSDIAQEANVHIFNISGQKVMSQSVSLQQGQNVLPFNNLSLLQPGVYIVQLVTNNSTVSQKIIKH